MSTPARSVSHSIRGPRQIGVNSTVSSTESTSLNKGTLGLPSVLTTTARRYHLADATFDTQGRCTSAADGTIGSSDLHLVNGDLPDSGATAGTELVGIIQTINAKGVITAWAHLDNTGGNAPLTRAYAAQFKGTQSINDSSATQLIYSTPDANFKNTFSSFSMVNTGTGLFTVPVTGWYDIEANGLYNTNSASQRSLSLIVTTSDPVATNAVLAISAAVGAAAAVGSNHIHKLYRFTAGDTFKFSTTHNIGAPTSYAFDVGVRLVSKAA